MHEVQIIKADRKITDRNRGKDKDILRVAPYARVSTDTEEQISSYRSQVEYYTDLVQKKENWELVEVYSDEAVTGTKVEKREGFQRMIADTMDGRIDMIITKSISRFARNTLDTLKYVRMLKEKNVEVLFEDEKINTLTMDGELLFVVLSSVAQQEVENISANVKKGIRMKMKRGELVGCGSCLGYDYDPKTKSISVNKEEAKIVKYIYKRYCEGVGAYRIAQELTKKCYRTKKGNIRWYETTVIGIIKNEKYIGDLLMGKTFTVDPISKRKLKNFGEEEKYYIKNHHEPIVSREVYEQAQKIIRKRSRNTEPGKREPFTRKYPFSCKLKCFFCGRNLSRRLWHARTPNQKIVWQCMSYIKRGKKDCPYCKAVPEVLIEEAFVAAYQKLCHNKSDVLDEMIRRIRNVLGKNEDRKKLEEVLADIAQVEEKRLKLVEMRLDDVMSKDAYESVYTELEQRLLALKKQKVSYEKSTDRNRQFEKRINELRNVLESNEILSSFDPIVFESIVEKVIIGGVNEDNEKDPYKIAFVFKSGKTVISPEKNKPECEKLQSYNDNPKNVLQFHTTDTYRDGGGDEIIQTSCHYR